MLHKKTHCVGVMAWQDRNNSGCSSIRCWYRNWTENTVFPWPLGQSSHRFDSTSSNWGHDTMTMSIDQKVSTGHSCSPNNNQIQLEPFYFGCNTRKPTRILLYQFMQTTICNRGFHDGWLVFHSPFLSLLALLSITHIDSHKVSIVTRPQIHRQTIHGK